MFICIEGIAGGGKTIQAKLLAEYFRNAGDRDVFISSVYEGKQRKNISNFINLFGIKRDENAMMFLFQALHSVQRYEVEKALADNKIVIADRWRYSFFAHHIWQDTFSKNTKLMKEIDLLSYGSLYPDLCLLIDLPAEIAHKRYLDRGKKINDHGLELMDLKYFISVSEYYRDLAKNKKWHIIDGTKDIQTVFNNIRYIIDKIS